MDPHSFTRPFVAPLVTLALALAVSGCDQKQEPPGAKREPLARGSAVPAAPAPAPQPAPTPVTLAPTAPAPAPSPTREPAEARRPSAAGVKVKRLVVTRAIENREPVETAAFSAGDEPVFAFVELENQSDETGTVFITFERDGAKSVGHVKLEVPAKQSRWRTWGKTRYLREAGTWQAVVRTPQGAELAKQEFEVGAS